MSDLPEDATQRLIDQAFTIWIDPEIQRRGNLAREDIHSALITISPSSTPRVMLNEECKLVAKLKMRSPVLVTEGDPVYDENVESVEFVQPQQVDENDAWLVITRVAGTAIVTFDFRRNLGTARTLIGRAEEFLVLARHALDSNSPGPAIENAFAAMELAVKAEMYLIEDNPTRQHPQRLAWWTDWEQHGNSPAGSSAVLGLLYAQRGSARYGDRPIELSEPEIAAAIADVEQTIEHASDRTKPIVG